MTSNFVLGFWKGLKILVFVSFLYTAAVLIRIGATTEAIQVTYAAAFFLIFNKLDSIDRRMNKLELRKNGR